MTPRVAFDYQLTPTAMAYASASEGFKSGSFDGREMSSALYNLQAIAPETVFTYEVGAKTAIVGGMSPRAIRLSNTVGTRQRPLGFFIPSPS